MRKSLAFVLLLAVGCAANRAVAPVPATRPVEAAVTCYENKAANVRFCYPKAWQVVKGDATLSLALRCDTASGSPLLTIDDPVLPPHLFGLIPLGAVEFGFVNDLRNRYKQVRVTSSSAIDLAGSKSRLNRSTGLADGSPVVVNVILCVHGDAVYVIEARTTPTDEAVAKKAIDMVVSSWTWLD